MGSMKVILGVAVRVAVAIVCIKLIPPYFPNSEIQHFITNEALQSTYGSRSETDIRDAVIKHARDYDIELTVAQVKVTRTGINGGGSLSIEADYSIPVSLPGYT